MTELRVLPSARSLDCNARPREKVRVKTMSSGTEFRAAAGELRGLWLRRGGRYYKQRFAAAALPESFDSKTEPGIP